MSQGQPALGWNGAWQQVINNPNSLLSGTFQNPNDARITQVKVSYNDANGAEVVLADVNQSLTTGQGFIAEYTIPEGSNLTVQVEGKQDGMSKTESEARRLLQETLPAQDLSADKITDLVYNLVLSYNSRDNLRKRTLRNGFNKVLKSEDNIAKYQREFAGLRAEDSEVKIQVTILKNGQEIVNREYKQKREVQGKLQTSNS